MLYFFAKAPKIPREFYLCLTFSYVTYITELAFFNDLVNFYVLLILITIDQLLTIILHPFGVIKHPLPTMSSFSMNIFLYIGSSRKSCSLCQNCIPYFWWQLHFHWGPLPACLESPPSLELVISSTTPLSISQILLPALSAFLLHFNLIYFLLLIIHFGRSSHVFLSLGNKLKSQHLYCCLCNPEQSFIQVVSEKRKEHHYKTVLVTRRLTLLSHIKDMTLTMMGLAYWSEFKPITCVEILVVLFQDWQWNVYSVVINTLHQIDLSHACESVVLVKLILWPLLVDVWTMHIGSCQAISFKFLHLSYKLS